MERKTKCSSSNAILFSHNLLFPTLFIVCVTEPFKEASFFPLVNHVEPCGCNLYRNHIKLMR